MLITKTVAGDTSVRGLYGCDITRYAIMIFSYLIPRKTTVTGLQFAAMIRRYHDWKSNKKVAIMADAVEEMSCAQLRKCTLDCRVKNCSRDRIWETK